MEESRKKRPIGISILSWLHILGGAAGAAIVVAFLPGMWNTPEALGVLNAIGIPPALLLLAIVFLLILACLSGVGMWMGKRWGWFLGSFYYAYSVVRNIIALAAIPGLLGALSSEELAEATHGPGYYYAKHGTRVVVHALLYLYFFKSNVRAYFGFRNRRRWLPAIVQIVICIAIVASFSLTAGIKTSSGTQASKITELEVLFQKGSYEEVVARATAYLDANPDSEVVWAQLGWARTKLDQIDEARVCFLKAIELDPKWDNAYVGLGVLCRKQGDLAGARAQYLKAIEVLPENAEAFSSLLVIELMDGNDEQAVSYGERAWALRKDDPSIPANLAIAYHYLGDTDKRDQFCDIAERLGYHNMAGIRDIINGKSSIR